MAKVIAHLNGVDYRIAGEHSQESAERMAENFKLKEGPLTIHVEAGDSSSAVDIRRELIWSSGARLA